MQQPRRRVAARLDGRQARVGREPTVRAELVSRCAQVALDCEEALHEVERGGRRGERLVGAAAEHLLAEGLHGARLEGEVSGEHREEQHARRPHVGLRAVVLLLREDLWRRIVRRAAEQLELLVGRPDILGEAKVGEQHAAAAVEQQVVELQIAVDDMHHTVAVAQRRRELPAVGAGCGLVEGPTLVEQVAQRAAGRVLQHEADGGRRQEHLEAARDVRVAELLVELHLGVGALAQLRVAQLCAQHRLDGDAPARQLVNREPHLAVRTLA
mmetsp:Transcript_16269/g.41497  ORF Transcript_16269/g.41497 Transcript_16269/m.41497 type:complete len:270 (+) Transcript_16269:611-1420(+)